LACPKSIPKFEKTISVLLDLAVATEGDNLLSEKLKSNSMWVARDLSKNPGFIWIYEA
jgi:hypothetical protein